MKKRTYLVAYAHVLRCEKAADENEAAKLAFGVGYDYTVTVLEVPKLPRLMRQKDVVAAQERLAKLHFGRTGNVLSGYEKLPGIANVHWTQCPYCGKPILTEPASAGVDDSPCQDCVSRLVGVPSELSVSETRRRMGVKHRDAWRN